MLRSSLNALAEHPTLRYYRSLRCYPSLPNAATLLQIIVLLVHEGDQQPALTEPRGLRCYHSLELLNCGATLGGRAFLGGANGNIYEVVMQAKTVELVSSQLVRASLHIIESAAEHGREMRGCPFHQPKLCSC